MTAQFGARTYPCGRTMGDFAGGASSVSGSRYGDGKTTYRLCHPNDPQRPDCYRLVTVYGETIGEGKNR